MNLFRPDGGPRLLRRRTTRWNLEPFGCGLTRLIQSTHRNLLQLGVGEFGSSVTTVTLKCSCRIVSGNTIFAKALSAAISV